MRWFVEMSPLGTKSGQETTLCVEAPQWQPALQKARGIRGDTGALGNFSIELLDDGFRAIDPVTRVRYVVKRAPDDAPLTSGTPSNPPPSAAPTPEAPVTPADSSSPKKRAPAPTVDFSSSGAALIQHESVAEPPPEARKREPAPTMAFTSSGSAAVNAPVAEPPPPPTPSAPALPSFVIIGSREDNPTEASPLTYREYVYAVAAGTAEEEARLLILERFEHVQALLDAAHAGKLINLAVFDHVFHGRPQRRPVVTLTWKDWKTEEPEVHFPQREAATETPTPLASRSSAPAPAPAASAPAAPAPASPPAAAPVAPAPVAPAPAVDPIKPIVAPAPAAPIAKAPETDDAWAEEPEKPAPKPAPAKVEPAKPAAVAAAPAAVGRAAAAPSAPPPSSGPVSAAPSKRLAGDDLLSEMFEAFGDLHFSRDSLEGAEFVLNLTLEKLPSEVGLVSLFDMNKREFVVVRQAGGPRSALCARQPERANLAITAMRKRHAIVISSAAEATAAMDDRWRAIGVELKSLVCAPVELSGRYLGLIELANPSDGHAFNEGDGNALTYIGQQFAEFVASHGVIVDAELIRGEAAKPEAPAPRSIPAPKASSGRSGPSSKKGR